MDFRLGISVHARMSASTSVCVYASMHVLLYYKSLPELRTPQCSFRTFDATTLLSLPLSLDLLVSPYLTLITFIYCVCPSHYLPLPVSILPVKPTNYMSVCLAVLVCHFSLLPRTAGPMQQFETGQMTWTNTDHLKHPINQKHLSTSNIDHFCKTGLLQGLLQVGLLLHIKSHSYVVCPLQRTGNSIKTWPLPICTREPGHSYSSLPQHLRTAPQ